MQQSPDISFYRVSNTPGNPGNLLELFFPPGNLGNLMEIYKVSWKLQVCMFVVNISYSSCISDSECISTKYLVVNQDKLILRLVISVSVS